MIRRSLVLSSCYLFLLRLNIPRLAYARLGPVASGVRSATRVSVSAAERLKTKAQGALRALLVNNDAPCDLIE